MAVSRRRAVPVAVAAAADAWPAVQDLRGDPAIRVVSTPRHATVLLVAGTVPPAHEEALRRVHDQVPHPRAVVTWCARTAVELAAVAHVDGGLDDVVGVLQRAGDAVTAEPHHSTTDLLPDVDPTEWRGVGPFGQGGEGMMGGTPYGRPMTMTRDDRDGLALDQLHLTLGPFLDAVPGGVELDVTLQGEVLQEVTVRAQPAGADAMTTAPDDADLALARDLLRRMAHALHVAGLDALAARAAALGRRVTDTADRAVLLRDAARLARWVERSGLPRRLRGVGTIGGHDATDRSRARFAMLRALLGAGPAGPTAPRPGRIEPDELTGATLTAALTGATLTDAVATIASLDLSGRVRTAAPA